MDTEDDCKQPGCTTTSSHPVFFPRSPSWRPCWWPKYIASRFSSPASFQLQEYLEQGFSMCLEVLNKEGYAVSREADNLQ